MVVLFMDAGDVKSGLKAAHLRTPQFRIQSYYDNPVWRGCLLMEYQVTLYYKDTRRFGVIRSVQRDGCFVARGQARGGSKDAAKAAG